MGHRFPIEAQAEAVSHSKGEFWDTVSGPMAVGKLRPTLKANSGTRFPKQSPSGNRVPFWRRIPGCTFRLSCVAENASHSEARIRDTLSARAALRKLQPVLRPQSGTRLPEQRPWGKRVPFRHRSPSRARPRQTKSRLEREFQPAANARLCLAAYCCAPSRKKRRLK